MLGSMNLPAASPPDHAGGDSASGPAAEARRRHRLDQIFGDVLPDTTGDERGTGRPADDQWFLDNRPPHHG
jgi:hypothetical protein